MNESALEAADDAEDSKAALVALVLEQESRSDFPPFDVAAWEASRGQPERKTMTAKGTLQVVDQRIADMIDANLPRAITYRRRDFEVDAMMHELCHLEHMHHGPEFHALMDRRMPDGRRRKTLLEG